MMADLISRRSVSPIAQAIVYPLVIGLVALLVPAAEAALLHEWRFNDGTANDFITTSPVNGTLVGGASILGGELILDGTGTVDFNAAALAINTYPSITIEVFAKPAPVDGFRTLLGFGEVDPANTNFASNYLILQAQRGNDVTRAAIATNNRVSGMGGEAGPFDFEDFADGIEVADNQEHHYAFVLSGPTATTDPNTIKLYIDGSLQTVRPAVGTLPIGTYPVGAANGGDPDANNMIANIATEFARIGAAYPVDPLFVGRVGQIRLYDNPRTALQISLAAQAGQVGDPGPTVSIDRVTGAMTFSNMQSPPLSVVGYSITSVAGALNQGAWQSITDNFDANSGTSIIFDSDNNWTKLTAAGSQTDFSEFEFDGGDGGLFGAGGGTLSLPLGVAGAWVRSPFEDLVVEMRLDDGTDFPVAIEYTGNNNQPYVVGDLDFDGAATPTPLDLDDWNILLANNGRTFPGLSDAASYAFGDLNGDQRNDRVDFRIFKNAFFAQSGAAALARLVAGVPEPSTLSLLGIACAAWLPRRTRRGLGQLVGSRGSRMRLISLAGVLVAAWSLVAGRADADVVHRYSFSEAATGDATGIPIVDSVSGANGVVRGTGSSASGTQLTLVGGTSDMAAYVDLPNGILSALTDATIETWYTINTAHEMQGWARIWDFGATAGGELTMPGGGGNGTDFLFLSHERGTNIEQQRLGMGNDDPLFLGSDPGSVASGFFDMDTEFIQALSTQYHSVVVFDADGAGEGMATVTAYFEAVIAPGANAAPPGSNPNPVGYQLANLNDVNNWLGRSNWTVDYNFGGSYNEFRIYDHALSESDVTTDWILGPDAEPGGSVFSLEIDPVSGEGTLINNHTAPLNIDYYELSSDAGDLNTSWAGVDGPTTPGAGWDPTGGSDESHLIELYLPEGGYTIPALGQVPIGQVLIPGGGGVAGDYNENDVVDAADYTTWRDSLGQSIELPNTDSGDTDGVVTMAEYTFWKSRFGATTGSGGGSGGGSYQLGLTLATGAFLEGNVFFSSGSGASAAAGVPEPSLWALLAGGLLGWGAVGRRRTSMADRSSAGPGAARIQHSTQRRQTMSSHPRIGSWSRGVMALVIGVVLSTASDASFRDRFHQFGDDLAGGELPEVGQPPNSTFGAFTLDSAAVGAIDFQDLAPSGGGPVYANTQATGRPGAAASEWGLSFDGVDDALVRANGALGSPAIGDGDVATYGDPPNPNFTGITTRSMEVWVRPTNAALGRQDVVNDTAQFGIFISADDRWGFVQGTTTVTSSASVAFNTWTHVMHQTFTNDAAVLFVNGVAVAATTNNYDTGALTNNLVFGASTPASANFFAGQLDNASIRVAGNATAQGGQNHGVIDLANDNDFIRQQVMGKPLGDVDNNGTLDPSVDVPLFIANWLSTHQVSGVTVGDMTTRVRGDFNLNGLVDIDDAFTLHEGLMAVGAGGLDFSRLTSGVPEPASAVLALSALAGLAGFGRRRGWSAGH